METKEHLIETRKGNLSSEIKQIYQSKRSLLKSFEPKFLQIIFIMAIKALKFSNKNDLSCRDFTSFYIIYQNIVEYVG